MASSVPAVAGVSAIAAAQAAIDHTRRNLFPIRFEKWLVLGFLAFLDQCGRAFTGGGAPGGRGHGPHPGGWPGGEGAGLQEEVTRAVTTATAWLSAHAPEVAIGTILGLLILGALIAVVLWINARGTFMYLDDVASGRFDVARPWREHARAADSYFGWRLGLAFATLGVFLFAAGLVVVAMVAFARGRLEGAGGGLALLGLVPVLLILAVALPLLALAGLALRDFVAPLQLTTGLSCGLAARVLEGLVIEHPGAFLLYLVLKFVLVVLTAAVVTLLGCLTCCFGFLPVVLQTLFQPLFFFERSFPLFLLKQMGHDLPGRLGAPAAG
jgi:hypothetical protein